MLGCTKNGSAFLDLPKECPENRKVLVVSKAQVNCTNREARKIVSVRCAVADSKTYRPQSQRR
jgi:hypothetical protein